MFRRILDSRSFVAGLLAMATGLALFYRVPFPEEQVFLKVIALRAPQALLSFKYLYWVCLFSTPYMVYAGMLSVHPEILASDEPLNDDHRRAMDRPRRSIRCLPISYRRG